MRPIFSAISFEDMDTDRLEADSMTFGFYCTQVRANMKKNSLYKSGKLKPNLVDG